MTDLGKVLIFMGALMAIVGVVLVLSGRMHLPIGRLPGDIVYRGKNSTVYFPIVTSIVISILLSVILYFVSRFR